MQKITLTIGVLILGTTALSSTGWRCTVVRPAGQVLLADHNPLRPIGHPSQMPPQIHACASHRTSENQCSRNRGTTTRLPDAVECVVRNSEESRRLLLSAEGAARIEFYGATGKRRQARIFLLPTDAKEVDRLVRAVYSLIGSRSATPATVWEPPPEWRNTIVRCRKAGLVRAVRIGIGTEKHNFVWEGVRKEIETVALLGLAKAIDSREQAESLMRQGNQPAAIKRYGESLNEFMAWADVRCERYGMAIFEPKVAITLKDELPPHQEIEIRLSQERIVGYPGVTDAVAAKYLPAAWRESTDGMELKRWQGVVIVRFKESNGWAFGLPVKTIPYRLMRRLVRGETHGPRNRVKE